MTHRAKVACYVTVTGQNRTEQNIGVSATAYLCVSMRLCARFLGSVVG